MKKTLMTSRIFLLVSVVFLLTGLKGVQAQSVITTDILEPIWTVPDTVMYIESTDITSSAEATTTILSEVRNQLPDSAFIADIHIRMEILKAEMDTIESEFKEFEEGDFKSKAVLFLRNELKILDTEKESLKGSLEKTSDNLILAFDRINYMQLTWDATLKNARTARFTPALIERTQEMLNESRTLSNLIRTNEEEVISISNDLLNIKTRIDILSVKLEELELHYEMIYLSKTHPALWEKDTMPPDSTIAITNIGLEVVDTYSRGFSDFYENYKIRIWINFVLFLVFLSISLIIRRDIKRGRITSDDGRIQTFFKIFNRPISISLLLALFLFMVFYPNASVAARDIVSFVIVIPLVSIALLVIPRFWHPLLIITTALFYFEEILETLRFESITLPRYLLLIIITLSAAYVIWVIILRIRHTRGPNRKKFSVADVAIFASIIILISAVIANITGYVAMSFFLFRGVVISLMAWVLISVTVTIVEGFLTLVIIGRSSKMLEVVREHGKMLVNRIIGVVKFFAILYWAGIVLKRFLIYDTVMDWLTGILSTKWVINDITISVEGILLFALIVFLSFWFSKLIRLILEKEVYTRVKLSRGIPGIISLLLRVGIITLGFILSLAVLGINLDKLTILIGALGVGIGFGLQDIINNLISGFILVFERPIQAGDTVKFGDKEGIVKEIGIRASTIKTYDGMELIVPNGKLISNELVNLTLSDNLTRVEIDVGTDYGSDPQEVIDILMMQAKLHPDILKNPEPFCVFFGFGDFALKFRLYAYSHLVQSRLRIRSELNLAISSAFKEAGIKIPYPIQDLNVNLEDKKPSDKK